MKTIKPLLPGLRHQLLWCNTCEQVDGFNFRVCEARCIVNSLNQCCYDLIGVCVMKATDRVKNGKNPPGVGFAHPRVLAQLDSARGFC